MKKVREPNLSDLWECPRCQSDFCGDCVDKFIVDFEILDEPEHLLKKIQWKGLIVCPWCYNQLVELKMNYETQQ